jgi:hypothetical protein
LTLAAALFTPVLATAASEAERGGRDTVRLLDVPYVPQSEALCGGAALAMVLRYWGGPPLHAEDFTALIEPGAAGIRTDTLVAAVRARGWTALPVTATPADLREHLGRGRPVIALLGVGSGALHYVVLVSWANGGVIYHDPAVAPFRVSSERDFDEAWVRSGRWGLLVLPPPNATEAAERGPARLDSTRTPVSAPDSAASATPETAARVIPTCDAMVGDAVAHARSGDTAAAERLLRAAEALCPGSAAPLREWAGLRFMAEDWKGAARLAERALRLDPGDRGTWRLLAGSRFLLGDEVGALRAWNRIAEPRADLARVDGLSRIRYRAVTRQLSLPPGSLLTSRAFVRARRRLAAMPAPSRTRLSLRPLPQGAAQVVAALLERPLLFDGPLDAGGTGLRAFAEREVSLRVASPMGNGELWTAAYGWRQERPRASVTLEVPAPRGRPGIWRVEGFWERQAYAGEAPPSADGAMLPLVIREERRRSSLSFSDWISSTVRLEAGAALDKFSGRGSHLSFEGAVEALPAGDRLALTARIAHWTSLDRGRPFVAGDLLALWSPNQVDEGGWFGRAGVSRASSGSPLAHWPGAGTGRGREPLLRAHPLLDDGVVTGRAFGRTLAHAGVERRSWAWTTKSLRLGWALFVDGAKPWDGMRSEGVPFQVDGGLAVRLAGLGTRGEVRVTAAHGFKDGSSAVTVGWEIR